MRHAHWYPKYSPRRPSGPTGASNIKSKKDTLKQQNKIVREKISNFVIKTLKNNFQCVLSCPWVDWYQYIECWECCSCCCCFYYYVTFLPHPRVTFVCLWNLDLFTVLLLYVNVCMYVCVILVLFYLYMWIYVHMYVCMYVLFWC